MEFTDMVNISIHAHYAGGDMPTGTVYKNIKGKKRACICPKCGEEHTLLIDWIGRGTPRKFCAPCKEQANERSSGLDNAFEFRARAISGRR